MPNPNARLKQLQKQKYSYGQVPKRGNSQYRTVLANQTNTVAPGQPGSQRAGQKYAVGIGPSGRFYHEYGSGQRAYIGPQNPLYSKYAAIERQRNQKRGQLKRQAQGQKHSPRAFI